MNFFDHAPYAPESFLIGDFSNTKGRYGGDYGMIETAYILGIPLFLAVVVSFTLLFTNKIKNPFRKGYSSSTVLFSLQMLALAFFHEIHYGIWTAKAILPLIFFSVAMLDYTNKKSGKF